MFPTSIQDKPSIQEGLKAQYHTLLGWLRANPDEQFSAIRYPDKWTVGQHAYHLIQSTEPLNQALALPKMALRGLFGKKNERPERSYPELVQYYQSKLSKGGRAPSKYEPPIITNTQKPVILNQLSNELEKLEKNLTKWEEDQMSIYLLPHPLMGKLTIREMLFFTVYHTGHHHRILAEKYS
ncbi:MAG: hypothetical protein Sapg2KO_16740 [Saprospiraceae bacterium]